MCQANVSPVLAVDEIQRLLDDNVIAVPWQASTAYAFGDVVVPTLANGHKYKLIVIRIGALSGATEPNWPTGPWFWFGTSAEVADGNLTWREDGAVTDLWDLNAAAKQGWLLKAAKVALCQDSTIDGVGSFQFSGVYDHCLRQAEKYNSVVCA